MSMTEVVEEALKADARFRHLTVMPLNWDEIKRLRKSIADKVDAFIKHLESGNDQG